MKRIFLICTCLIICLAPFAAVAQEGITIYFKDGRQQTIPYHEINRIEFRSSGHSETGFGREISIEGLWKTSQGETRFRQTGNQITGSYLPQEHGEITGNLNGNVMSGYWIEDSSSRKCAFQKNGRYHWGRIQLVFEGNRFSGKWGYCDSDLTTSWTGSR